jgi:3-oxoacyl-[acyl-carrier protein] reductase
MADPKTAVVTGALGVLGKAIVDALLADGLRVALVDLDVDRIKALCKKYPSGNLLPIACDISVPTEVEHAVERIREQWNCVDVLINNAGILSNNKALQTTDDEWRRVLAVNLDGAFYFSRAFMEDMKRKGWGRIVNITSLAAKTGGITAGTAYSVSKGALIALTFSLANELAPFGVTVNGIAPAYVKTPMVMSQLTEEERQTVMAKIPVKRFCEPEEVAHTVRFLIHPLAGFITGEIIDQNGGLQFD